MVIALEDRSESSRFAILLALRPFQNNISQLASLYHSDRETQLKHMPTCLVCGAGAVIPVDLLPCFPQLAASIVNSLTLVHNYSITTAIGDA